MENQSRKCHICETELKDGYLYSGQSIDWYNNDDSLLKKTLSMGKRISKGQFFSEGKVQSIYCKTCKTITIENVNFEKQDKSKK